MLTCRDVHSLPSLMFFYGVMFWHTLSLYILSFYNQKRGGAALNAPLSNRSKSFDEQDSSPAFVRLSIVRLDSRPPALQKHASLTKKRSVALHSQKLKKCYAARSIMYIRPMVISFLKANAMSDFLWGMKSRIFVSNRRLVFD